MKGNGTVVLHGHVAGDDNALNCGYAYWRAEVGAEARGHLRDLAGIVSAHGLYSVTAFDWPCEVAADRKFEEIQSPDGLELVVCDDCFFWRWEVGDHEYATTELISFDRLEKEWAKL